MTVKDTNTGTREMTTLKKYSTYVSYSVNLKLIIINFNTPVVCKSHTIEHLRKGKNGIKLWKAISLVN